VRRGGGGGGDGDGDRRFGEWSFIEVDRREVGGDAGGGDVGEELFKCLVSLSSDLLDDIFKKNRRSSKIQLLLSLFLLPLTFST
jgi:hypothetical protein